MISSIFSTIGEAITAFIGNLTSAITSISALFYNSEAGTMTFLGTLLLIAAGIGLVYWAFRLIKGLIKRA